MIDGIFFFPCLISGPRTKKPKKPPSEKGNVTPEDKRPRTAFSGPQLARLKVGLEIIYINLRNF